MKSAIITGASSGIGKTTAKKLAKEGYAVVLAARRGEKLSKLESKLRNDGMKALAVECDVTKRSDCKNMVTQCLDEFGSIDVLVNNAGIMPLSFIKNLHQDEWDNMIDVNIKGVLNCIAAALPHMIENRNGHIVNISSIAGIKTYPTATVYCATKYAVEAITEGMRLELSDRYNIKTTVIRPGSIDTDLTDSITDKEAVEWTKKTAPDLEFIEPENVANAILYALLQPENIAVNEVMVRPQSQKL